MIIFISVLSFLLDGIFSKYLHATLFIPLLTIVSLVLIFPYFKGNYYRFFKYLAILGLLYDISFANTLFFNTFLFMGLGFVIIFFFYILPNNLYTNVLATFLVILLYRIVVYLFLVLFTPISFSFSTLMTSIYSSLLLNILYCIITYLLTSYYSKKHKILRKS